VSTQVTVLFIHGTGQRLVDFEKTLKLIRERLPLARSADLKIEGCLWGDHLGSKQPSKSVPEFLESGGKEITDEDAKRQTWQLLSADPVCELRLLSLNKSKYQGGRPNEVSPGELIDEALKSLPAQVKSAELRALLERAEIYDIFDKSCSLLAEDPAYHRLLLVADTPIGRYLDAVANALVAEAVFLAAKPDAVQPLIDGDEELRDEVTTKIRKALGPLEAGIPERVVKTLGGMASSALSAGAYTASFAAVTPYLTWRRGEASKSSPIAGDILLYQTRGGDIKELICTRVSEFEPPVVLLAHSLGGVACVDLLIEKDLREKVQLLVTAGSQAPYFYEINALQSMEYKEGATLPDHFPRWVNLYNRRDFLSYIGEKVFPGKVLDLEVKSRQPFPQSHGAYWTRPESYDFIRKAIHDYVR